MSNQCCDLMTPYTSMQELHVTRQASSLDLADARRIIVAGERKASELGIPYNIAVADAGGGSVEQDVAVARAATGGFTS
jgi:uncharacterized protein GlcG (DUF336 family)